MSDFRSALEKDEDFQRGKEGIQRAQKLQKQAKKRDYYKILGVKRTATKKEINKVRFFYPAILLRILKAVSLPSGI